MYIHLRCASCDVVFISANGSHQTTHTDFPHARRMTATAAGAFHETKCCMYIVHATMKKKNEKCLLQSNLKSLKRLRAHTITTHQSINNFLLNTNEYDMQQYTFNFFSSPFYSSSGSILFVSSARVLGMWKLQFFSAFPLAPNFLLRAHTLCVASANTSAFPSFLRERSF